ncbi:MAG: hypothetical protein DMD64_04430 [Gemmatimonadetes bacterium]|nr:MAG: hypothetical protein DMD64_04430 [Gemmatimonadota bacterium]
MAAPATPIRVLVVEDDRVIRDVLLDAGLANGESSLIMKAIRSAGTVRLTKREREIKELIEAGLGNKEIAQRLNIATNTVKSHVHNMLGKLAALVPPDRRSGNRGRRSSRFS